MAKVFYSENIFDFLIKDRLKYWNFFKSNYAVITILLSAIGGLNQVINLFTISPTLVTYYSPKQGLIDGVLFLLFNFLIFLYFSIVTIMSFNIYHRKSDWALIVFLLCIVVVIFSLIWSGLMPIIWLLSIFVMSTTVVIVTSIYGIVKNNDEIKDKQNNVNYEKNTKLVIDSHDNGRISQRNGNRYGAIFIVIYFLFTFTTYYVTSKNIIQIDIENIYNYKNLEKKLERNDLKNFKLFYNNDNYIFLRNIETNEILVLESSIIFEDIIPK